MSVGFFGSAVVVGSLVLGDTAPDPAIAVGSLTVPKCEPPPSGFFWRYADVPQALKQPVELCWSFVGGTGVTPIASTAVTVPPLVLPNTLFDEVPPPVTSPNDR
jgi:hypothetical protein